MRGSPVALRVLLAFGVLLAPASSARADVVLHEYVAADPSEDLRLGATTSDGAMAAAIQTQGGPVSSPELESKPQGRGQVYGAERSAPGTDGSYRIDGNTSRPGTVSYGDPFTPGVAPYKREFAYDTVDSRLDLGVRDPSQSRLLVGGAARVEDDQFYADFEVELAAGQGVRIPTVGPSARLLAVRASPAVPLEFFHDSADNWFVKGDHDARIRLVLHLAADRGVFGSGFADVDWPRLWRFAPPLPDAVKSEGLRVARQIGVIDGTGPVEALRILVKHFRSFEPSDEHPRTPGASLYRDLALSQKGVCRHRSYAFVVTALALGMPARFVRNEAHAWVEVFDATRWHRIDLGGAADQLDFSDTRRIAHVPPRDPFDWPAASDSGQVAADRSRASQSGGTGGGGGSRRDGTSVSTVPTAPAAPGNPDDARPRSTVTLKVAGSVAKRGGRLEISGRVESRGGACAATRVDLYLEPSSGGPSAGSRERIPLGTLVTGEEGRYEGRVVVPYGVPPGDYDVGATTPGSLACGPGEQAP